MLVNLDRDICITDEWSAHEFLRAAGLDDHEHAELAELVMDNRMTDLEYELECLRSEFRGYELSLDAAQGVLNDVLNLCSERMEKERTQAGKRAYRAVYDLVYNSEAM